MRKTVLVVAALLLVGCQQQPQPKPTPKLVPQHSYFIEAAQNNRDGTITFQLKHDDFRLTGLCHPQFFAACDALSKRVGTDVADVSVDFHTAPALFEFEHFIYIKNEDGEFDIRNEAVAAMRIVRKESLRGKTE